MASKYRLVRELGRGAMGVVWEAEHLTLHAPVAVKLVDAELLEPSADDRDEVLARFVREARAVALMRSPHVVQILDHGVDQNVPFMVMELLEGETLQDRLERHEFLSPQATAKIITHIARAAGKAHDAGIVHRDLKPGNVFLVRNDEDEMGKVLDFGIAKFTSPGAQGGILATKTGHLIGTPAYMSPEQASGIAVVDYRSDLWAMGVIAFQCITGRLPFDSEGVGDLIVQICAKPIPVPSSVAEVPEGFDDWFARAVARDPAARFSSAKEMADSLREVLAASETNPKLMRPTAAVKRTPQVAARSADMTHRAVVSQLHQGGPKRSFVKILIASTLATSVALGGLVLYLVGSGATEVTTEGSTGNAAPAALVASGPTVEPVPVEPEAKPEANPSEDVPDAGANAGGSGAVTEGDTEAAEGDTAGITEVKSVPPAGRPYRPRSSTKKKVAPSDQDKRLGF